MSKEILAALQKAILELEGGQAMRLARAAIEAGVSPLEAIGQACVPGMKQVGERFEAGDLFLPEMVLAATIMKDVSEYLESFLPADSVKRLGTVLVGTVEGDIHDIGKNMVGTYLAARGFSVVDIGVDRPTDAFLDKALEVGADIIGASCLLTMNLPQLDKLVRSVQGRGLRERFSVIVGGAAVSREYAEKIRADGYGEDLNEAARVASALVQSRKGGGGVV